MINSMTSGTIYGRWENTMELIQNHEQIMTSTSFLPDRIAVNDHTDRVRKTSIISNASDFIFLSTII